jgi:hypothetical protein
MAARAGTMTFMSRQLAIALAFIAVSTSAAAAGDITKEACVDAHSRGQDAREQGKLSLARKLFFTCAQAGCPGAVQSDCAKFADDLTNLQPTIVFVARDGDGNDLPATSVYVDGVLVVTALDGKPQDIDPGNHTVRFSHGGRDEMLTVVIGSGEKGRTLQAKFGAATAAKPAPALVLEQPRTSSPRRPVSKTTHPSGSLALTITGGIVAAGGAAIAFYGISKVPSNCSLSTNECSAAPNDPVFAQAQSGARTMNIGIAIGGVGVAALAGGMVWYLAGAKTRTESATQVAPLVTPDGGGVAVLGRF